MQYLPARCDACSFVALVPHQPHEAALSPCTKCGAKVSFFPGAKHLACETPLFADLSAAVYTTVSPGAAAACLCGLEDVGDEAPALILSVITARMPAVAKLVAASRFLTSPASLAAMLLTILRARSSLRSHSAFAPRAAPSRDATLDGRRKRA